MARLPERRQVAGKLLDAAYEKHVETQRARLLEGGWSTIHMDAWSTHQKEHLLSVYAVPEQGRPQLLASDIMEERTHNHEEFKAHLERAVKKELKVSVIVADAESAGQKAGREWAEKREGCEGYLACSPHQLQRVANDVIGCHQKQRKPVPNPYNYLTVWVGQIVSAVVNVEHIRKTYFHALSRAGFSKRVPCVPGDTRWTSQDTVPLVFLRYSATGVFNRCQMKWISLKQNTNSLICLRKI